MAEAIGLALGLFPLVIEGVKFYISSAEKFKEMKHHKRTLDKFRRELVMEKSIFDNTWGTLVGRAGVLIEPNIKIPPEIIEEVLSCLPPYAVGSFVNGCQELNTILEELQEKFQEYEQDKAGYLKIFGIFRYFLKDDREECIERVHRLNENLDKLVNGAPTAAVEHRKVNVAEHYQRVRKHAMNLYDALKEGFQPSSCRCKVPHSANLGLDVCILGTRKNNAPKMGRLSLLFPVPAEQEKTEYLTLRELEFENLEDPDPVESTLDKKIQHSDMRELSSGPLLRPAIEDPIILQPDAEKTEPAKHNLSVSGYFSSIMRSRSPSRKPPKKVKICLPVPETHSSDTESSVVPSASAGRIIECFCSTIRSFQEMHTCVGILVSNNSKHQVWAPKPLLAMQTSARVVSLAELLNQPEPTRRERLKLSVRLASSVLQFHATEWLQERWGKQDVYFIQRISSQSKSPSLETPVVRQSFAPEPPILEGSIESHIIRCNLSLFSLGIVLIELYFWKSLESFQSNEPPTYEPQDQCGPSATSDTARFVTAQRLIDKLYGDAGVEYGDIVRRCINGIDHNETKLENDAFKNEVYLKVLQPLEKHLEVFFKEPLGKIFEKRVLKK